MSPSDFTDDPRVRPLLDDLKTWRAQGTAVSDIIDDEGHQYVDLVMEGGGVLGIALLGYTYAMEEAGLRFMHIGGTSAGSITAMLLAATDHKHRAKSADLVTVLAEQDLSEFMDGSRGARKFTAALLERKSTWSILWKARRIIDDLRKRYGLHPGDAFQKWIEQVLAERGITDTRSLTERVAEVPPGLRHREGVNADLRARLALITAEIRTETKVEFPRMAHLFWQDPDAVNPSHYVRASMSVPLFFLPYVVSNLPKDRSDAWDRDAGYNGAPPEPAYFMDGGIVSNFPIHVFHRRDGIPSRPTFGVKLGTDRQEPHDIERLSHVMGSVFNTARHALDYDFITRNPDYEHLVRCITTGEHHWLNFELTDADKVDLFYRGVRTARQFVTGFDWPGYKEVRRKLAEAEKRTGTASIPA